jgi:hypothetical protein
VLRRRPEIEDAILGDMTVLTEKEIKAVGCAAVGVNSPPGPQGLPERLMWPPWQRPRLAR